MTNPIGMRCVIPSRLGVGESFDLRIKLLGPVRSIPTRQQWNTPKPALGGPFNLNAERRIQYHDNVLPEWKGTLRIDGGDALDGPSSIVFDGADQGVFPGDTRPIGCFNGFRWRKPGFHFLRVIDSESGLECWANAVYVTEEAPPERIYWGDPHWQSFFSDGIRCPEELYAFARDEGFLDFGAISDHVEALTDRQWEYFVAVTNDYNEPGRFSTLVGQEWTNHAPGHRNIYYRTDHGPILRCTDPRYNTLDKLWAALDKLEDLDPIAIPHHSANKVMGVDWDQGWNPKYEKAVEIYSVWGSSEKHADDGNTRPIHSCGGEVRGQHVIDALKRGFHLGFVGGGDIHDGRPGDAMHGDSYPPREFRSHDQGLTACLAPVLTREAVHDAIKSRSTYATTLSRIYLDVTRDGMSLNVSAASEQGIQDVVAVTNTGDLVCLEPEGDTRTVEGIIDLSELGSTDFCYVRVTTKTGEMAWSSPTWG
ncbi:MAG: DUF3604 domain-containing protein [Lentisphaeria bacterium]|nr:DUF3604 domain-containing protein [Lentisphaeria bacterium]